MERMGERECRAKETTDEKEKGREKHGEKMKGVLGEGERERK